MKSNETRFTLFICGNKILVAQICWAYDWENSGMRNQRSNCEYANEQNWIKTWTQAQAMGLWCKGIRETRGQRDVRDNEEAQEGDKTHVKTNIKQENELKVFIGVNLLEIIQGIIHY